MEILLPSYYYHIYNRGNNREDLFRTPGNYQHFLHLYEKYIFPVAETFAWVLMRNHFHLLVKVKPPEGEVVDIDLKGLQNLSGQRDSATQAFSNLFNAYAKGFNKMFSRTGSLFEKPFHRKVVTSERYLRQVIIYIHHNPQNHGFVNNFRDYPWSSYGSILSVKPTRLSRDEVLGWFNNKGNFVEVHKQTVDLEMIRELIIE